MLPNDSRFYKKFIPITTLFLITKAFKVDFTLTLSHFPFTSTAKYNFTLITEI